MSDGEAKVENGIPSSHKTNDFVILPDGKLGSTSNNVIPPRLIDVEVKLICTNKTGSVVILRTGQIESLSGVYSRRSIPENVQGELKGQVVQKIYATHRAFAALTKGGRMVSWGHSDSGGDSSVVQGLPKGDVINNIYSTSHAFAALTTRGRVMTWGHDGFGGDSSSVQDELKRHGVKQIYSNGSAFAALMGNDRVVAWGHPYWGGDIPQRVQDELKIHGVKQIYSNGSAFVALMGNDRAVAWGNADAGGVIPYEVQNKFAMHGVRKIYSTDEAFAALLDNNRVVTWGYADAGGYIPPGVQGLLEGQDVKNIYTREEWFAAETVSGRLVIWGENIQGLINIPNGREVLDIVGNTIILDNWNTIALNNKSLGDDPNYLRFIRNRRLYTRAIKRTLLNAGDPDKVLKGPIDINQRAVLGNKDLRELLLPYLDVWRGGPEGEGEGEGEGE